MSPEIVYSIAGVLSILAVTVYIWWTLVIPQQRSKLAISKKKGDVKQFLDSIDDDSNNEDNNDGQKRMLRWVFTDWLRNRNIDTRVSKDAALPFLKKAKWNSGDNPILVAFGAIMACVIAASLAERF
eukprot:gene33846-43732_t